jgi:hypothetical protein
MGPDVLMWHYPNNDIMNGSLLTVESNQFCVLKSRGAILSVYGTGRATVEGPLPGSTGGIFRLARSRTPGVLNSHLYTRHFSRDPRREHFREYERSRALTLRATSFLE